MNLGGVGAPADNGHLSWLPSEGGPV